MKHILCLLSLLLIDIGSGLWAQEVASFQGSIYDGTRRKPLAGVQVIVERTLLTGQTDRRGFFQIEDLPQGFYLVRFQAPGYATVVREIVAEQAVVSIGLSMERRPGDDAIPELVTPQGFARNPFLSPASVSAVAAREINRSMPQGLGQALAGQPGLWTFQPGLGQAGVSLRGLSGQRVLTVMDGIRLSPLVWGDGADSYLGMLPVHAWGRVEVVPGGGGMIPYGADAIGGVVQVLSPDLAYTDQGWQVHGYGRGAWWQGSQQLGGRAGLSLHHGRVALSLEGGNWDMGDRIAG
ncbi:MAG: hypothetical protein D6722_11160, partial [Bacteroidetes bacterium]